MLLHVTLGEIIALLGLTQALFLIVYMALRAGRIRNAGLALACFLCLAVAFLADFASRSLGGLTFYPLVQDLLWSAIPGFSVLLAMQVAKIEGALEKRYFILLGLAPIAVVCGWFAGSLDQECTFLEICNITRHAVAITSILAGATSLLCLWIRRDLLSGLVLEKSYRSDRYWLILCLVLTNCALIFATFGFVSNLFGLTEWLVIRDILGCGLVYLASTSLFRIYPQTLKILPKSAVELNDKEEVLLKRIQDLISLQKVYQEPSYSRADFAQELKTSEAAVSKIVNIHFGKSVPQLLNEKRIEDACRMLKQTDAAISVIAEQVGFNSLPSFNRVFKDVTGCSPSEYRARPLEPSRQKA